MELDMFQADAFTSQVFGGNPAAVIQLDEWLPDEVLQKIALENNLSETAYFVKHDDEFDLRWFTPTVEVDLCGHATLATAHILFAELGYEKNKIIFNSKSGKLTVACEDDTYTMDFPLGEVSSRELKIDGELLLGIKHKSAHSAGPDLLVEFDKERDIVGIEPNLFEIAKLNYRGIIATAKGDNSDFVTRYFAPQSGINEDPVTGSIHTNLSNYWSKKLNKTTFSAMQLSNRRGYLECTIKGDRVLISGKAVTYLKGKVYI